jgi:hypothetical protein
MRKFLPIAVLIGFAYFAYDESGVVDRVDDDASVVRSVLAEAYEHRRSNIQVEGDGEVVRILSDDTDGDRHQRFILRLQSGQTLLIAHNVDLAPRLPRLSVGDPVQFFGEYEWNDQGGVIHWTHRDPQGRHVAGWLRHNGKIYQ